MAFIAGRFTAFTSCGVMAHSERSTGCAELGQVARELELLGALRVAEGIPRDDPQARVAAPVVGIADADLQGRELLLGAARVCGAIHSSLSMRCAKAARRLWTITSARAFSLAGKYFST